MPAIKNSTSVPNASNGRPDASVTLPASGQCSAGLTLCSGTCVNLQNDQDNCGACGFPVPYGETCQNGKFSSPQGQNPAVTAQKSTTVAAMQGSCPSGQSSCSDTCRDLQNDAANCGSCGNICPSGQNCQNARCSLPVTSAPVVTTSTPLTIVPESCSGGDALCNNTCVDLFTSKENCGVCGRACKSQEICVNARCGPACTESGTSLCGDSCVDLDTDSNNCGACGTTCPDLLANSKGSECMQGQCIIIQCNSGYADCNKKLSDGCEVNLLLDASNCGSCGTQCPEGQVCYSKKCSKPIGT